MSKLCTVTLPAKVESLSEFTEKVLGRAREVALPDDKYNTLELCLEELVVNVCNYAYGSDEGDITVSCKVEDEDKFTVEIRDSGVAFNPLELEKPDIDANIEDRPIGGLGVFLVKNMTDNVEYLREGDENVFRFTLEK